MAKKKKVAVHPAMVETVVGNASASKKIWWRESAQWQYFSKTTRYQSSSWMECWFGS